MWEIDKKAYQPVYSQLVDILRHQIDDGKYPPGSWLPSEAKLKARYDVSSVTIRRAIRILVEQGVVETTKGKGTVVKPFNFDTVSFDLANIHDIFKDPGDAKVKLLYLEIMPAPESVIKKLKIQEGDKVIHLQRMVTQGKTPLIYHHQFLRYDATQHIEREDLTIASFSGFLDCIGKGGLEHSKGNIKKGLLKLKVAAMGREEAACFQTREGTPTFHLEHLFFNTKDQPFIWGYFSFCDANMFFSTRVGTWCEV